MIKKFSEAYAPSGREEEVRKIIIDELSDFFSDIKIDNLGNLIIHKPGSYKKIAVTAPMDEVGFIITHTDNNNLVIGSSIGYVNQSTLHDFLLNDGDGYKYMVLKNDKNPYNNKKYSNLQIKLLTGCKVDKLNIDFLSKTLIFDKNYIENDDYIIGKSLERSVTCSILCDIARSITDSMYEYYFIFTAQNYCDKKGAIVAAHGLEIDELYNICCVDTDENISLGKGPVYIDRDKMMISNQNLKEKINKHNVQRLVSDNLVCEGGYFQRQPNIKAVTSIGVPVMNLCCPNEVVLKEDIKLTYDIVMQFILP